MTPGQVPQIPPPNPQQTDTQAQTAAIKKVFDVGVGRYDVTVTVGPSYQSKRQEAVSSMMEFMRVNPQSAPLIADLVARNSDWNGAKEIADRLKKMLPPQLQDNDASDPQAQMQQLQQQNSALVQELQLATQHLQQLQQDVAQKKYESDSKFAMAKMQAEIKAQTDIAVAEIMSKSQNAKIRADFELKQLQMSQDLDEMLHGSAHDVAMQQQDHANQMQLADQQHQQQVAASAQQADQQQQMAAAQPQEPAQQPEQTQQ